MQATPKTYIPDLIGSLGTRSFMLVCLCAAFPMTSNGNPVVEVVQRDVVMSWGINTTDISSNRLVINPAGSTVILFSPNSVIGTVTPAFINRVRDVGNVSLGMASFRLLNLTVADAGRYYYKIIPATDAGGQVLVIAGNPDVSIMEVADPFENNKYTMLCSAQSTSLPPGMGLTMHYQWKNEKGQNIPASDRYSFSSDQSNLTINPLKRQDAGTFVCDAWEHIGAVSQSGPFSLKVFFTTDPPTTTTATTPASAVMTTNSSPVNEGEKDSHQLVIIISVSVGVIVIVIVIIISCRFYCHHRRNNEQKMNEKHDGKPTHGSNSISMDYVTSTSPDDSYIDTKEVTKTNSAKTISNDQIQ